MRDDAQAVEATHAWAMHVVPAVQSLARAHTAGTGPVAIPQPATTNASAAHDSPEPQARMRGGYARSRRRSTAPVSVGAAPAPYLGSMLAPIRSMPAGNDQPYETSTSGLVPQNRQVRASSIPPIAR